MRPTATPPALRVLILATAALALAACSGGGSLSSSEAATAGNFRVEGINVQQGAIWQLNRAIKLEFNHPVDPQSVGFGAIVIRPKGGSGVTAPVTGQFFMEPGSRDKIVVFQPNCPTNEENDNGAFLPGGVEYEIELPTNAKVGNTILRDTAGHPLIQGLSRTFRTPIPPLEPLFLDTNPTPPTITGVVWPKRLNMFTDPEPIVEIRFDQSIDGRSTNLNTERLYILYSDQELGAGLPTFTNKVPGTLVLAENCTATGATVHFVISGLLPPNRALQLTMENTFRDISGQRNESSSTQPLHETPTLAAIYNDPTWNEDDETVDEFADSYVTEEFIDAAAGLTLPPASFTDGQMTASFDYPGQFVAEDQDFTLTSSNSIINTTGQTVFTDSLNKLHTIDNGVLYVDDFTLGSAATLRARGDNPLIIYAQGTVVLEGELNASGNDSHWPTSLNSPQFPEGGAPGECSGGRGGTASQIGDAATPRGEPGDGPFGLFVGAGGQGGEGGFQQTANIGSSTLETANILSAGGGGGAFAKTANVSILWEEWRSNQRPNGVDNFGPDHDEAKHVYWPDGTNDPNDPMPKVFGAEDGLRGGNNGANLITPADPFPQMPHGVYGMEDEQVDVTNPVDALNQFDPAWDQPGPNPYDYGHPTRGPDGGRAGISIFSNDGNTQNDFWGRRLNADGTVSVGELLTPWSGYGGGASGDSQEIVRQDIDPNFPGLDPLPNFFPADPFPPTGGFYRKGAPGGGGGGQVQILAIGPIIIGADAEIMVNGGIGHGGESTIFTAGQCSGSGGGSGGHLILHSATRIDFSALDIGSAANVGELPNLEPEYALQAFGGRRGWAGSWLAKNQQNLDNGNGNLMTGRGGAGSNGVIQIHVPDPSTDIIWPPAAANAIRVYIHDFDPINNAPNPDKVEEMLGLFAAPNPYILLPIFASGSQFQSKWIDTGLAGLRNPANGTGVYPDWFSAMLRFDGLDSDGFVPVDAVNKVIPLGNVASGPLTAVTVGNTELVVPSASTYFAPHFLRAPDTLVGYDVLPDETNHTATFEVVSATVNGDTLRLVTKGSDGAMTFAVNPGSPWAVRQKFFRVSTTGQKDTLGSNASVRIEFQAADDPEVLSSIVPGPTAWTAEMSTFPGKRFIRYRVSFDIDKAKTGVDPASPKPAIEYMKLPFVW